MGLSNPGPWPLTVDKDVDKLCALVCWDNLINWLNNGNFLDLNLPTIGTGLAPGATFPVQRYDNVSF